MSREPILRVELRGDAPVYRQIADALRAHLVHGDLTPGDALPTVRELAIDLGVHFNTVAEAYRVLAEEGWLDLKRRRGATVLDRVQPSAPDPERTDHFAQRLREWVAEVRAAGVPKARVMTMLRSAAEVLE